MRQEPHRYDKKDRQMDINEPSERIAPGAAPEVAKGKVDDEGEYRYQRDAQHHLIIEYRLEEFNDGIVCSSRGSPGCDGRR